MSSQFTERIRSRIDRHGHALTKIIEPHPHQRVTAVNGESLNLKQSQLLTLHQSVATFRKQATGNFANVLTSGGSIDIPISENAGFGFVNDVYLRIDINNGTGGNIEMLPVAYWLNRLEWTTPTGDRIQIQYADNLFLDTDCMNSKEWKIWSPHMNVSKNWGFLGDIVPNGQNRSYYLKLSHNWIQQTGILLPHIDGEIIARLYFEPATAFMITGTAPTITRLELEFHSPFMLQSEFATALNNHRSKVHDFRYFWNIRQTFTNSFGPGQQIDFLLSGFNGLFSEISFYVRASGSNLKNLFNYQPLERFDILDENGQSMIGSNDEFRIEDRIEYSQSYNNDQRNHLEVYRYHFNLSACRDKQIGSLSGYNSFNSRQNLRIFTEAAIVNKVETFTTTAGNPVAGNYRIRYKDEVTDYIVHTAAVGVIKAAIEALPSFLEKNEIVTVLGTLDAGAVTVTYSGNLQREEPDENLSVESGVLLAQDIDSAITTRFVEGFDPTVQYEIVIMGKQLHRLRTTIDGRLMIMST